MLKDFSKYYLEENVLEAARKRISYIYDEFDDVVVSFSGGKDSTVVLHLCLDEAKKRGIEKTKVLTLDQEAEWRATHDYVKSIMHRDDVEPLWLQVEFDLFNATTTDDRSSWFIPWEKGKEDIWIYEKDDVAIKENYFNERRFKKVLIAFIEDYYSGSNKKVAVIGGVRAEESPRRYSGLTVYPVHKWITWGAKYKSKNIVRLYPIYDWSYTDVWKFIYENNLEYNRVYDYMYQHGDDIKHMRVSSLVHETSLDNIKTIHEYERDTWEKLITRIGGIDTAGKYRSELYDVGELPFMFKSWREYRDYLVENLTSGKAQESFKRMFAGYDKKFGGEGDTYYKTCVKAILKNDYHSTTMENYVRAMNWILYQRRQK